MTTDDAPRRVELSHFLRAKRARLSPGQVGLPVTGRRRTPGLRREEVAQLADVGTSWYTWLEQGRAITVSAAVLDSLARALRLDATERDYLFVLARREEPVPPLASDDVGLAVRQILSALGSYPAYVANARWDAVAWNEAACRVFVDFAALPASERNMLRFMFVNPLARRLYADWESAAQRVLSLFRAGTGRYVGEDWFEAFVTELSCESREFAAWWPRVDICGIPQGGKEIDHPRVGRLVLEPTIFLAPQTSNLCMIVYTPAPGTETAARLQRLAATAAAGVAR